MLNGSNFFTKLQLSPGSSLGVRLGFWLSSRTLGHRTRAAVIEATQSLTPHDTVAPPKEATASLPFYQSARFAKFRRHFQHPTATTNCGGQVLALIAAGEG